MSDRALRIAGVVALLGFAVLVPFVFGPYRVG